MSAMRFLRRSKNVNSRKANHHASRQHAHNGLGVERLEDRLMLSASTVGDAFLVNDYVVGEQSVSESSTAVVSTAVNTVIVYEGQGPVDYQGVFAKVLAVDGSTTTASFRVNSTISGDQYSPTVGADEEGNFVVAWAGRGIGDMHGVFVQRFNSTGGAVGVETLVNSTAGGQQTEPALAVAADGSFTVAWSGVGTGDFSGVYLRRFDSNGVALGGEVLVNSTTGDQQTTPSIAFDAAGNLAVAWQSRHQDGSDWGVFGQWFDASGARIGGEAVLSTTTLDSQTQVTLATDFTGGIVAAWQSRGQDGDGWGVVARHFDNGGTPTGDEVLLNDLAAGDQRDVSISVASDGQWLAAWSSGTEDGSGWEIVARSFEADGTAGISEIVNQNSFGLNSGHQYRPSVAIAGENAHIVWTGAGMVDHQGVYTQRYALALEDQDLLAPNLVAFAQAIAATGTQFFGAGWCPTCTAQKELFQDGSSSLPFVEATNPDRTINQVGIDNDIDINNLPTWVFADGTRLEGLQTLQTLSDRTGVAIPTSDQPFLETLTDAALLVGSPLHVALDGYDPNGGPLTYTVTSDNADVTATILSDNRSARINVAGYGDMVFELFEQRAERATSRMIELAESDFYEDIIFHRVLNDFVIQGGDPTGTGSGGSTLGDFDDQFNPDLQHNRTGLLSMAKSTDDTNDSQFFVTEGPQRHLDFVHTIFGLLVEGEANRDAISNTTVNSGGQPAIDVVMEGIDIFDDTENGVLMLKAADGTTGSANITVTVTDQDGNSFDRTFRVDLAPDTFNGTPYLGDIAPVSVARNTTAEIQLTSVDVEGDPVFYTASMPATPAGTVVTVSAAGLVSVIPPMDFVGSIDIEVGVGRVAGSPDDLQALQVEFT